MFAEDFTGSIFRGRQQRLFGHCRGFRSAIAQRFEPFGANGREFGLGGLQISATILSLFLEDFLYLFVPLLHKRDHVREEQEEGDQERHTRDGTGDKDGKASS
jgi:hypothetical protein